MSKNTKTLTQWCDPDATKATVLTNESHHAKPFFKSLFVFRPDSAYLSTKIAKKCTIPTPR
jgi:hypothetical protein